MVVFKNGLRKYTCPCCDSMLGYTHSDIYEKVFCDPEKRYKRFCYIGPEREIDFSKEWVSVFYIKCPVCGKEIELFSRLYKAEQKKIFDKIERK